MFGRSNRERQWRRFDEDEEFRRRAGALDRRWGYGNRLSPGYERPMSSGQRSSEYEYIDEYNAPDYWVYQLEWLPPGPFTGFGPRGYQRSDERILEDVCDRLTQHAQIDASDIEVEVSDGEVTLTGTAEDRRTKRMVEANVELVPGVIDIHNRLRLRHRRDDSEEQRAREMAEKFPGGPEPTGPAAMRQQEDTPDIGSERFI